MIFGRFGRFGRLHYVCLHPRSFTPVRSSSSPQHDVVSESHQVLRPITNSTDKIRHEHATCRYAYVNHAGSTTVDICTFPGRFGFSQPSTQFSRLEPLTFLSADHAEHFYQRCLEHSFASGPSGGGYTTYVRHIQPARLAGAQVSRDVRKGAHHCEK